MERKISIERMQSILVKRMQEQPQIDRIENLIRLGNFRFDNYQKTHDPKERRLAANCYLAARGLEKKYKNCDPGGFWQLE